MNVDVGSLHWVAFLGRGKLATVTLCKEGQSSRSLHAVKTLPRKQVTSKDQVARVFRERDALRDLSGHPGIICLRSTGKDDTNVYFVLEPALGGSLHRHIRGGRGGHLECQTARYYTSEMIAALDHIHSLRYMHRDLKANNVVLCSRGHTKLVDFGCAKRLPPTDEGGGARPRSFTFCGTPHCMAPEMMAKVGHAAAVDWWALGVLIFEMLTGQPPFGYEAADLKVRVPAGFSEDEGLVMLTRSLGDEDASAVVPLIRQLLEVDSDQRLGSGGASEVMSHPWFEGLDWAAINEHQTDTPTFSQDMGEMEYAQKALEWDDNPDPDGLFADF